MIEKIKQEIIFVKGYINTDTALLINNHRKTCSLMECLESNLARLEDLEERLQGLEEQNESNY